MYFISQDAPLVSHVYGKWQDYPDKLYPPPTNLFSGRWMFRFHLSRSLFLTSRVCCSFFFFRYSFFLISFTSSLRRSTLNFSWVALVCSVLKLISIAWVSSKAGYLHLAILVFHSLFVLTDHVSLTDTRLSLHGVTQILNHLLLWLDELFFGLDLICFGNQAP